MSEAGFRVFNQTFSLGAGLLYATFLTIFFRPFMAQGKKGRKLFLVFSLCFLIELVCSRAALPQGSFWLILTIVLLLASKWIGLEKFWVLLLTLLYFNTRVSSGLMAESFYFLLEQWLPAPTEPLEAVFLRATVLVTLFLATHATLFALLLYTLQRRLQKRQIPLRRRELYYLGLVPTAGILFGQIISRLLIELKDGVLLQLYERHPGFLAAVPLLALLFYMGAYLAIAFQQGMAVLQEEQATWFAERQQIQALRGRIQEMEQFYSQTRSLKHELRGHLTNLKGLARSGEYARLEAYIAQMDDSIRDFELTRQTGNPVTDIIVSDASQRCQRQGIGLQSDFHYPAAGNFDAFDLGIILQNLLQNALEACEKVSEGERFIVLTGKRKGHFFLIEVKNSFAGEVVFGQDGLPVTTKKEDIPMHGIGLSNVRREAEKYLGELELKADQLEFSATVLLQGRSSL